MSEKSFDHLDSNRDSYGFAVRPQHLHRFREYAKIYKEEEEERSDKWSEFLEQQAEPSQSQSTEEHSETVHIQETEQKEEVDSGDAKSDSDDSSQHDPQEDVPGVSVAEVCKVKTWDLIKPTLAAIENMMSLRVKKRKNTKDVKVTLSKDHLSSIEEAIQSEGESEDEENFEEESRGNEILDDSASSSATGSDANDEDEGVSLEHSFPWKEELESLVLGGVPKALRGEVWQAFVGVKTRRVEGYYKKMLDMEADAQDNSQSLPIKLKRQVEKDLPRTFPGHPALNEHGRDSLRRVLLAYARHNPSVGYCQAMNFFAGLLLLMMPEENAFWTLAGIIDDYFDGYYSEEMIESQVDQLVFEELMREKFPKLVNHLDYLGVQVAWISGPWFLSIFVNMLPWESVLRVWDVLLFEGNRIMLFRTALALMDLYGPALVTTKDAGDAISLLQSLAGSTFDSSQLVLTACMGYLAVTEARLQDLRNKHRPSVLLVVEERLTGCQVSKDTKSIASKLYSFKRPPVSLINDTKTVQDGDVSPLASSSNFEEFLSGLTDTPEVDSDPDLEEQVIWMKVELCKLLDEKRSATLRSEELETALMEMVKQDNRRQLSAKVEQLEQEVSELKQSLNDKREQENAMLQVLMRIEQEQRLTEDARRSAEHDAAAQRYAVHILQEKYEKAMSSIAEMKKRVVMAESMLEATLQYESGQVKAQASPTTVQNTKKTGLLSIPFGLGWRDRNKGKPANNEETNEIKPSNEVLDLSNSQKDTKECNA